MLRRLITLIFGVALWLHVSHAYALTCPSTINASVPTVGGSKQMGRLNRGTPPTACGVTNTPPAIINPGGNYTYNVHTFKNRTLSTCMTATLKSNDDVAAAAYTGAFDPLNIQTNYLGDTGNRPTPGNPITFSFDVPSLGDFDIVVTEGVDGGGGSYQLDVIDCGAVLVTSVTPDFGPTAGGTNVTISGVGFLSTPGLPTVRFGGTAATNVVVVDEFTITATTPAHAAGLVSVQVQNANGSQDTLGGAFTYYAPFTPTFTLTSDANPSVFGQPVTFTAHIDPTTPAVATGDVEFRDNGVMIGTGTLNGSGDAMFTTSSLTVGSHPITAHYPGDVFFQSGTSGILTQVVDKADTTTMVISSSNPSVVGTPVTFTATVAAAAPGAGTPTGNVVFTQDGNVVGTVAVDVNGQAQVILAALAQGTTTIVASYGGDGNFNPSTSADFVQTVNLTGTVVTIASSLNPSTFGVNVTFTATVTVVGGAGGTPTGTVTFSDNGVDIGGGPITIDGMGKASFSTSTLAVGTHPITASYSGDGTNQPGTASVSQVVNGALTTVALVSSVNPSAQGQSVTFTATVSSAIAGSITGTVTFKDGTSTLGTGNLDANKKATFSTASLSNGTHSITAVYGGNALFGTSTSAAVSQVVGKDNDAGTGGSDAGTNLPTPVPDASTGSGTTEGGGCDCRSASTGAGFSSMLLGTAVIAILAGLRRRRRR